jgi:hypothetical protein
MTAAACPATDELFLLLDGELTENRALRVREHVAGCTVCRAEVESLHRLVRDVAVPVEPLPGALERVMARLDESPKASRGRWRPALGGVLGVVAVAATVVLGPAIARHGDHGGASSFAARGSAEHSLARDVGVTLHRHTTRLDLLSPGAEVTADTAYAVSFRNLGPAGSAQLTVFAQDAAGEVHWVEPVWLDPASDPASVPLPHTDTESAPRSSVVMERPATGELRIFILVTTQPVHVSEVERLASTRIDAEALRAQWPGAVVDMTPVRVLEAPEGSAP